MVARRLAAGFFDGTNSVTAKSRATASGAVCQPNGPNVYFDHTETVVAMVVAILWTDHLFSPLGTMVKHLGFECVQVVQKPVALSYHVPVPALALPPCTRGSRVIFPSGVKVILNLVPEGVLAVKAWPVKKVA
jgi:hypothetical protein